MKTKILPFKCVFSLLNQKITVGLMETGWLNAVVRLRPKIYSRCRCNDTDNVAPRDIRTSNSSIEFNDAMIMIILCIEMCQRICRE